MRYTLSLLKTASFLTLVSVAISSYAGPESKTKSWQPYVGAGVGYSILDVRNNHYQDVGGFVAYSKYSGTAKSPVGYVFLGIQKPIESFAIGGELYGLLSQQKASTNVYVSAIDYHQESVQRTYGYGAKLKFGYFLNPMTMIYLHGGAEKSHFKYKGTINVLGSTQNFKKNKSLWGLPLGVGLESNISPVWKARLEYTYTKYKSWKTDNLITGDIATSKLNVHQHSIMLGFAYQF